MQVISDAKSGSRVETNARTSSGMDMWPHKYTMRVSLTDMQFRLKIIASRESSSPGNSKHCNAGRNKSSCES